MSGVARSNQSPEVIQSVKMLYSRTPMAKVDRIIELLSARINRGDYTVRPFPAEAKLAEETGVSRMTARKAILSLVGRGELRRLPNGRLVVGTLEAAPRNASGRRGNPSNRLGRPANGTPTPMRHIGFAAPAYGSAEIDRWRIAAERAVALAGVRLRILHFHHWDDPILTEALKSFESLFIVPPAEPVTEALATRLRDGPARVVALDCDLTPHGIRSINLAPPTTVVRLPLD